MPTYDGRALFGAHLELAPLRAKSRGLVRCIFHDDHTASLSVDLDRGLFHCFTCGAEGGLRDFARRVGVALGPPDRLPRTPAEDAMRRVLRHAADVAARRAEWLVSWAVQDLGRARDRTAAALRALATELGACPRAWDLADRAAAIDRYTAQLSAAGEACQIQRGLLKGPDARP